MKLVSTIAIGLVATFGLIAADWLGLGRVR